jgi:hypothetical protein
MKRHLDVSSDPFAQALRSRLVSKPYVTAWLDDFITLQALQEERTSALRNSPLLRASSKHASQGFTLFMQLAPETVLEVGVSSPLRYSYSLSFSVRT